MSGKSGKPYQNVKAKQFHDLKTDEVTPTLTYNTYCVKTKVFLNGNELMSIFCSCSLLKWISVCVKSIHQDRRHFHLTSQQQNEENKLRKTTDDIQKPTETIKIYDISLT